MEQRKYPRVVVHYPGAFRGDNLGGEGVVMNLSQAGCAFHSEQALQLGAFVEVDLHVPGETVPIRVDVATVRWAKDRLFGLDFLHVSPDQQARLRRFLRTPGWFRRVKDMITGASSS